MNNLCHYFYLMNEKEDSCAENFLRIISNSNIETFSLFLTSLERDKVSKTCTDAKCYFDWNFNFKKFYKIFTTYHYPALEFLWVLNIFQVMPLEIYIFNISTEKDVLQKFTESVFKLCSQDFEDDDAKYMTQTGFLSYFVRKSFSTEDEPSNDIKINEICLKTITLLLQDIFSTGKNEMKSKRFVCFFSVWNAGILEETSLQNFCIFMLDYYLNLSPIVKDLNVFEILLGNQCSIELPYHHSVVLEKILKSLKPDRITFALSSAVQKIQINAASLLVTVKAFLRIHQVAFVCISKLTSELMNEAYEKFIYELLLRTILIEYQATYQPGILPHIHYKLWLQNIFKECSHSKNKDSFSLLIQVLSDIVPFYKSIEYLKVALDLNISIPSNAQTLYSDYVILLKTRIQDLKPSLNPEETVEKMLTLFENMGKIPPVVMEISLLQKHKFLNEFLPALLVPRVVPPVPDLKERFIEALNKAGKIPNNLFQLYKDSCKQEQNKIVTDIDVMNENFDDFLEEE